MNEYSNDVTNDFPTASQDTTERSSNKFESIGFIILVVTLILAPLAFIPSEYTTLELAKSLVVTLGVLASAILFGISAFKEKSISLPPKGILFSGIAVVISVIISALLSGVVSKSFFGQGFELSTGSFIGVMFLTAWAVYSAVSRFNYRALIIYGAIAIPFSLLFIFQGLRIIFGADFATLNILPSLTSTIFGNWFSLGIASTLLVIVSVCAMSFLSLTGRLRIMIWALFVISLLTAFIANSPLVWLLSAIIFAGLAVFITMIRRRDSSGGVSLIKSIAWIPLVLCLVAIAITWRFDTLVAPALNKMQVGYQEISLPWQFTLDVTTDALKNDTLFGVGPNRFGQAYINYKPVIINRSPAWEIDFSNGVGYIPTMFTQTGIVGILSWILFFVFLGILATKSLKNLPNLPRGKFIIVSSWTGAVFLWVVSIVYLPSHVTLFYTFIITAVAVGSSVSYGIAKTNIVAPTSSGRSKILSVIVIALLIIVAAWAILYIRTASALLYFDVGIRHLNENGDIGKAAQSFTKANNLHASDIYLQAVAETGISAAQSLVSSLPQNATQEQANEIAQQIGGILNESLGAARAAVTLDPTNYFNHISEARVSEAASKLQIPESYENAVKAYTSAINAYPLNPALYMNLARLHASTQKYDEALVAIGNALRVKDNYLEAIFLYSQIRAAQGNIPDAITAVKLALEIDPQNPILMFQLGLLEYNAKNYIGAVEAFEGAIAIQNDYANAKYFLGLSLARLNKNAEAINIFQELATSNPDNQEVALILSNLRSGKSPFADAEPPVTATPEKRSELPLEEEETE